ncbi:hypothetical protein WI28_06935 [Burkholderia diffusa]|nr:hypothetical protein WI28_06935 [Burkholderia diffusa]
MKEVALRRKTLEGEEVAVVVATLRMMQERLRAGKANATPPGRMRKVPLWTSQGWVRDRPVYAVSDMAIAHALATHIPVWLPGCEVSNVSACLEPLGLKLITPGDSHVVTPEDAEPDDAATAIFERAVSHLHEDLSRNDPQVAVALSIQWESLKCFKVLRHPSLHVRLAGVYSTLLRLPGNRFESVDVIPDLRPYGTALRRLLTWVATTQNSNVLQEIHEALRHFPEQLTQVVCDQMELLLGTAALLDQALADVTNSPMQVSSKEADGFLAQMESRNKRQQLAGLRSAVLEWASSAAAESATAAGKFIDFIASDVQWPEQFRSALIRALPPLMHTAASTNTVLPFLYGAMVGESALVRMAAAQALRELRHSSMADLPSLVHDAFLLLLSDPIVGVHQSAVEVLERISFPEEYEDRITEQVMVIFMAYAQGDREHDSFLVTCIELLVGRLHENPRFSRVWGPIFVAALTKVDAATVLGHGHSWMLTRLATVKGFPDLLLKLLRSEECYETYDDKLVSLLRELPKHYLLGMQASLVALCERRSDDWVLAAACIEVFSVVGAWDVAAKIAGQSYDILPDSTRMLVRKQYAQLSVIGIEFERNLAAGNHVDALECASQWRQTFENVKRNRGDE